MIFLAFVIGVVVGVAATFGLAAIVHSSEISESERDHPDAY